MTPEQLLQRIERLERQVNDMQLASQISYDSEQALRTRLDTPEYGIFTPTATLVTNLDSGSASEAQYLRVGNMVIVSGVITINPTATGVTRLGLSLPLSSGLIATGDCAGTLCADTVASESGVIFADTTNARAQATWNATNTAAHDMHYIYMYRLI